MRGSRVEGTRQVNPRIVNWNPLPSQAFRLGSSCFVEPLGTMSSNSYSERLAVAVLRIMGVCFVVQQVLAVVAIRRPDDRVDVPSRRARPAATARMAQIGAPPPPSQRVKRCRGVISRWRLPRIRAGCGLRRSAAQPHRPARRRLSKSEVMTQSRLAVPSGEWL